MFQTWKNEDREDVWVKMWDKILYFGLNPHLGYTYPPWNSSPKGEFSIGSICKGYVKKPKFSQMKVHPDKNYIQQTNEHDNFMLVYLAS